MFDGFVTILITDHTDNNYRKKQFKEGCEIGGNMPNDWKIENPEFSQLQSKKSEEINFYGRKYQNRKRQYKGNKYEDYTRSV